MTYRRPGFCDYCGDPHPWANRQARIYQLENILDEQDIDEAARLKAHEDLQTLRQSDLPEDEQIQLWQRIRAHSPGLMSAGGRIIESLASAAIRAQLGL